MERELPSGLASVLGNAAHITKSASDMVKDPQTPGYVVDVVSSSVTSQASEVVF